MGLKKIQLLVIKSLLKTRKLLLWVPVFSFIFGSLISVYIYKNLLQRERANLKMESTQRSREMINQIDLLISNSILRIQSYEEDIGSRPRDYQKDSSYIRQSLQYTIFQRLAIFRASELKTTKPDMKLLVRITTNNSVLPQATSDSLQSPELRRAIQSIVENNEYQRAVLYNRLDIPRLSVVLRSKNHSDIFFIFVTPLASVFDKIDLRPGEAAFITDHETDLSWKISREGTKKIIAPIQIGKSFEGPNHHTYFFNDGLPQSGLKVNFSFQLLEPENNLSPAVIAGLMSLFVTLVVSYLFWVLVSQNRIVTSLVLQKTKDLERAHHELQEALMAKTRFLGNISHEIRTPLNLILGMIDLCEERDKEKIISEYLSSMRSSGNHLLSMIEDLLDLAKADSNDLQIHPKKINLLQFLEETAKISGQDCTKKGLRFYTHFAPQLPAAVKCDPSRLRQILMNLLRNACKYTNDGHVILRVQVVSRADQTAKLRFEIEDTGVGIPRDKMGKIFDAFFQVESSYLLAEGGVGLGLAIVKELVQKLHGSVNVRMAPDHGSIFQVDLDLEVMEESNWLDNFKVADGLPRELNFVSSDHYWMESVSSLAYHPYLHVIQSKPSELSQLLADSRHSHKKNRWLIVDSTVPNFSFESFQKHGASGNVIIVGNKRHILDSQETWEIPVLDNAPTLLSEVLMAVGFSGRSRKKADLKEAAPLAAAQKAAVDEATKDLSLIVADDDIGNKELYMAYFSSKSWHVEYAMNGQEAWDLYLKKPSDVIILDVRMPVMDGFEVVEKIRKHEQSQGLPTKPIILVTADALESTADKALSLPKVTFLTKPIRRATLFDSIGKTVLDATPT